jgi:hypothetical protein
MARRSWSRRRLSVLDTVTGRAKQWTYQSKLNTFPPGTGNVSISADGTVVGFANEVIDTDAASGAWPRTPASWRPTASSARPPSSAA